MRVLVAFEVSGIVRDAFRKRGHEAWSCDLLEPSDVPESILPAQQFPQFHIKADARDVMVMPGWDMMIAHPPCTYLTNAGVRWLHTQAGRWEKMERDAKLYADVCNADIPRKAIENPVQHCYARAAHGCPPADQFVQPWQHGHGETKATGLTLYNLPKLVPTNIVEGREARVHNESPGEWRWLKRSLTCPGIADAMANQWGSL